MLAPLWPGSQWAGRGLSIQIDLNKFHDNHLIEGPKRLLQFLLRLCRWFALVQFHQRALGIIGSQAEDSIGTIFRRRWVLDRERKQKRIAKVPWGSLVIIVRFFRIRIVERGVDSNSIRLKCTPCN